jgi:GT2 family glycosyltransferase
VSGDAVLRRTALAGAAGLTLPSVSIVVSSKRVDDLEVCLGYLAAQTYPAFEVVLGTHGYAADDATVARWAQTVGVPLRVVAVPAERTLGEALGALSRAADGEYVAKVDDDDHYGPQHLTDLVLAARTSGAALVAKAARFVHFPDFGFTIDRRWGAPEAFDVTVAGGTTLIPRGALLEAGGWSTSPRHVDTDLVRRIRAAGGLTYRTHALEYVYVRRSAGHTWAADQTTLLAQGEERFPGLPSRLLDASA